jgi:hypothetical protein
MQPTPAFQCVAQINQELEKGVASRLLSERSIETHWSAARALNWESPYYWLLMTRIAEAALLCAGNHADNCEYRSAGDFLVNPREIRITCLKDKRSIIKHRHGRLSDQLRKPGMDRGHWLQQVTGDTGIAVTKPPLLPHMGQVLRDSKSVSGEYLRRFEEGQCRVADTLAFLAAWRLTDSSDLWRRMQGCSAKERDFAVSNLCRFDTGTFQRIGRDLSNALSQPGYKSSFLCGRYAGGAQMIPKRPAEVPVVSARPAW